MYHTVMKLFSYRPQTFKFIGSINVSVKTFPKYYIYQIKIYEIAALIILASKNLEYTVIVKIIRLHILKIQNYFKFNSKNFVTRFIYRFKVWKIYC